MVIILHRLMLV
ncbi:hypothetical protein F383_14382 [Gossypium arboreum]|uniref:Uncharacterized protein n=1 Tax=Gossypium arboreum TaxID=29729 RepID=A0A0B0MCX8_GOSAR|nr:hypothetical protein F383_14382 [Gossypium arboreum]